MAGFRASQLHFWRLLPIGVATVLVGALTFLIAFDAAEAGFQATSLMAFLVYGVPISVVVSIIMLVPMTLVWNIAFLSVRKTSELQLRATLSSGISALTGVAFCIVLFVQLTDDIWRTVSVLLPASMLPVFVAVVLTWNAFRTLTSEER